jgi:hypothetical protein
MDTREVRVRAAEDPDALGKAFEVKTLRRQA